MGMPLRSGNMLQSKMCNLVTLHHTSSTSFLLTSSINFAPNSEERHPIRDSDKVILLENQAQVLNYHHYKTQNGVRMVLAAQCIADAH